MNKPEEEATAPVFNPGKARWVREKTEQLTDDQQALLLAMTRLETELGRKLSPEEATAIESLAEHLEGFDSQDIAKAVHQMVTRPADPDRQISWPKLKPRKS